MYFTIRDKVALFPAHAGVILKDELAGTFGNPFPRTRGGDPVSERLIGGNYAFSPHTRG